MGCGSSSVPDVIIPDPKPGDKCKVLFKKTGMFASDQNVFQDCDTTKKWLMMDKEGSLFSNPTYTLENFVREDGSKRGQPLCFAKLKITEAKTYGRECHEDSDSSSADSTDGEVEETVEKMKWAQAVKVEFFSDKTESEKIAVIKVKAKGKAKKTTTVTTTTDEEGNEQTSTTFDIDKKIKKVKYVITEMKGIDKADLPPITLEGKPNKSAYKLKWTGPVFQAEIDSSGWTSQEIEVETDYSNPALGMLMGYVIAKEISPDDIMDKVSVW
jgi:hypothetical protein